MVNWSWDWLCRAQKLFSHPHLHVLGNILLSTCWLCLLWLWILTPPLCLTPLIHHFSVGCCKTARSHLTQTGGRKPQMTRQVLEHPPPHRPGPQLSGTGCWMCTAPRPGKSENWAKPKQVCPQLEVAPEVTEPTTHSPVVSACNPDLPEGDTHPLSQVTWVSEADQPWRPQRWASGSGLASQTVWMQQLDPARAIKLSSKTHYWKGCFLPVGNALWKGTWNPNSALPEMDILAAGAGRFLSMAQLVCNGIFLLHPKGSELLQNLSESPYQVWVQLIDGRTYHLRLYQIKKPPCTFTLHFAPRGCVRQRHSSNAVPTLVLLTLGSTSEISWETENWRLLGCTMGPQNQNFWVYF